MANSNVKSHISVTSGSPSSAQDWRPGFHHTPWSAMILILIMLACMGASAGIIISSDKQTVVSWKVQPAVLLAVLSSILNYVLDAALAISIAITWWKSALRGTTLAHLHHIWDRGAGFSLISALRVGVDARKVTLLAGLVAAAQFVNNPLLQRSTHIRTENVVADETIVLNITRRLPDGWFGSIQNASSATIIGSRNGLSNTQEWWWNKTISTYNETGYYCDGTCRGNVQGAGIGYSCNSTAEALDLSAKENDGAVLFAINTTMSTNSTGAPVLVLTTLYTSAINDSCIATINVDTCSIEAAVVEYPVLIQNTTITREKLQNIPVVSTYISAGDLPTASTGQGAGPLEGLNDFLGFYLEASTTLIIDPSRNSSIYSGGGLWADLFFIPEISNYDDSIPRTCVLEFSSPTEYVLDSMNDFMFRASLQASTATDVQTFSVQRTNEALIFYSNYRFLAAALAVMLLALLAVLFLLWGWWELGRHVSLSPLETAKAFGPPMMQDAGSNSAVDGILEAIGPMGVRYDGEGGIILQSPEGRNEEESKEEVTEHGHQMQQDSGEAEPV